MNGIISTFILSIRDIFPVRVINVMIVCYDCYKFATFAGGFRAVLQDLLNCCILADIYYVLSRVNKSYLW
jgi:hypothetical protein